ncbi:hypothetical protein HYU23_02260 [Candidatus Woesearchaeota archaeon]|nr:hypothetical protein [Candidatus Woesearchaeota archaeon]
MKKATLVTILIAGCSVDGLPITSHDLGSNLEMSKPTEAQRSNCVFSYKFNRPNPLEDVCGKTYAIDKDTKETKGYNGEAREFGPDNSYIEIRNKDGQPMELSGGKIQIDLDFRPDVLPKKLQLGSEYQVLATTYNEEKGIESWYVHLSKEQIDGKEGGLDVDFAKTNKCFGIDNSNGIALVEDIKPGSWNHMRATYDGNKNKMSINLNGRSKEWEPHTRGLCSKADAVTLGVLINSLGMPIGQFRGALDNVTVLDEIGD